MRLRITTAPAPSTPCTCNTDFAISRPIVLTSPMDGSPQCGLLRQNHPMALLMPQSGRRPQHQKRTFAVQNGMSALPQRSVQAWPCLPDHARQLRRTQYFLEISISEDKDNYYGRVHCNDEPKQNPSLSTQPRYFIAGLSEFL